MGFRKFISDQKQSGFSEGARPKREEGWIRFKSSKSHYVSLSGREEITTKTTRYERYLPFHSKKRIASIALGALAVIGTLGFSLLSKGIRQLFTGRQVFVLRVQERHAKKERIPEPEPVAQAYDETLQEMLNEIQPHVEAEKTARIARQIHPKKH
ncbi:MAG: hypothetical protein ACK5MA_03700 [Parachlamydiaceae bacterium]